MAVATVEAALTEPGVYEMTAEQYHADPVAGGSLSSTWARKLLDPSCPAKFRYERDHGQPPKREFDIGHAAHQLVLGAGPDLVVIDADSYRTKDAREQRDEAHDCGHVPLLVAEYEQVEAMAAAIRQHPLAARLFDPAHGRPEVTLIWRDQTGVMCRARYDWLPERLGGRLIIPDYKTCASADPEALMRAVHQHGYHQQADWYMAGARALGLAGQHDLAFLFVCQEKTPPYVVTIVELDAEALRVGAARNRRALSIYAHCASTGQWPGYVDGIHLLSLPPWAVISEGEHLS